MKPLDDIKIVGMTHIGAGPYCLSLLADMGAQIINIEPIWGDSLRGRDESGLAGDSAYFHAVNRNKRSIALDVANARGLEIAKRLISEADVFVENLRVGALEKYGLDYESVAGWHPELVYTSISPWGQQGPDADRPGMDLVAQARGGIMGLNGHRDQAPCRVPPPIADFTATYLACFGTLLAIRAQERDGKGQHVDVSLLGGQVATLANFIPYHKRTGKPDGPVGSAHPQLVPYQPFQGADGYFIVACLTDAMFVRLCGVLGRQDLADDQRFKLNGDRVQNRDALVQMLSPLFVSKPVDYWLEALHEADVPAGRIQTLADVLVDPQVTANEYVHWFRLPHGRKTEDLPVAGIPVKLSRTPGEIVEGASALGQHTEEVLRELGLADEAVEDLRDRKVVK